MVAIILIILSIYQGFVGSGSLIVTNWLLQNVDLGELLDVVVQHLLNLPLGGFPGYSVKCRFLDHTARLTGPASPGKQYGNRCF